MLCAFIAGLFVLMFPAMTIANPRWNLLCVMTDDQAHWSIGAYGNRESKTPHTDRLAREGALFLNAFVATPVCSPSRAAFFTGRYGTQLGITDYITPQEARAGLGLPTNALTWPQVLQRHGYFTGLIGKWHLGEMAEHHPTRRGFDYFYGDLGGSFAPMNPKLEVDGEVRVIPGAASEIITEAALRFLDTNYARPFALLVHYREPHMPYGPMPVEDETLFESLDPTIPDVPNLRTNEVKRWTRGYYASVHAADRSLGRLLDRLETLQLSERTIVIFTSDHGYNLGHHGLHSKGNARWVLQGTNSATRPNMFDESVRTPLLIRWPGVVKAGRRISAPVSNIDTFATVLGMLEIPAPVDWTQEGRDFSPLLRGRRFTPRKEIFAQFDLHTGGQAQMRMVRTSNWKLVRFFNDTGINELYDLKNDPSEARNYHDHPDYRKIQLDLEKRLRRWQRSIDDPVLKPGN